MPVAAADRPVNAFSSEITTGMSAPPIGSTTKLPEQRRADQHADDEERLGVRRRRRSRSPRATRERRAARRLIELLAAPSVIGRPGRISWSLPNAMFEPQKETEPTIAANSDGIAT